MSSRGSEPSKIVDSIAGIRLLPPTRPVGIRRDSITGPFWRARGPNLTSNEPVLGSYKLSIQPPACGEGVTMSDVESQPALEGLVAQYVGGGLSRRQFVKGALALGLGMTGIGSLLAACSSSTTGGSTTPKQGGTLKEGYDLDFSRRDPINTNWYDPAFDAVQESPVTNAPQGNYVPQIASSWTVANDGLSVTFKIRSGLKFHTGAKLDATAIKAVYDGIADPKNGSPLGSVWAPVASTEAPDPTTLVIKLKHPYFDLFNIVKTGYWDIVNMAYRAQLGDKYGQQGVDGSGPFQLVDWVPGSHTSVKRWEGYPGSVTPSIQ